MKLITGELEKIINLHLPDFKNITEDEFSFRSSASKWSKKEILGHLIDSAQNNIRRFVVAQYEESPTIIYNQDKWVLIANYQQWNTNEIINLWYLLNKQICYILNNMPESSYKRTVQTETLKTIEWLAADYLKHLRHHIHVIFNLEPVVYP